MDPFLGGIRAFPWGFAPKGWAPCNGQTLPINQNAALFSLLGTMYGGNGTTNFMLPNLQGRVPIHVGQQGGTPYTQGQVGGAESVSLVGANLPPHGHNMNAVAGSAGTQPNAAGAVPAKVGAGAPGVTLNVYAQAGSGSTVQLAADTVSNTGGGGAHNNMQPYLALNFCIATQGLFPSRP